jgi:hypothetical protein
MRAEEARHPADGKKLLPSLPDVRLDRRDLDNRGARGRCGWAYSISIDDAVMTARRQHDQSALL